METRLGKVTASLCLMKKMITFNNIGVLSLTLAGRKSTNQNVNLEQCDDGLVASLDAK